MLEKTGILLEGGAMRSIFSAGVLDYFLEQKLLIPNVIGVSAGAYAGMNYLSEQRGRVVETNIDYLEKEKYVGFKTLFRTGTYFDMELLFNKIPNELNPFDFETFRSAGKKFITSTINCMSGEAVYYSDFQDKATFLRTCRAANSLPLLARITRLDNAPMLDGGMADAIPIGKALEEGWEKIIVILTRDSSYRKKKGGLYVRAIRHLYDEYPNLGKAMGERYHIYNDELEQIAKLEKEGRAFVFRPTKLQVKNSETDVRKLKLYYNHGYEDAKERFQSLLQFLERK